MRRWLRWLFNSMVMLSTLLFVATMVLWIQHTWFSKDTFGGSGERTQPTQWKLDKDGVQWNYYRWTATVVSKRKTYTGFNVPGFYYLHYIGQSPLIEESFHFYVGYRFLLAVGSILPLCWFCTAMWLKNWKPKIGMCVACGYDLRATPVRCPECGKVAAKPKI